MGRQRGRTRAGPGRGDWAGGDGKTAGERVGVAAGSAVHRGCGKPRRVADAHRVCGRPTPCLLATGPGVPTDRRCPRSVDARIRTAGGAGRSSAHGRGLRRGRHRRQVGHRPGAVRRDRIDRRSHGDRRRSAAGPRRRTIPGAGHIEGIGTAWQPGGWHRAGGLRRGGLRRGRVGHGRVRRRPGSRGEGRRRRRGGRAGFGLADPFDGEEVVVAAGRSRRNRPVHIGIMGRHRAAPRLWSCVEATAGSRPSGLGSRCMVIGRHLLPPRSARCGQPS